MPPSKTKKSPSRPIKAALDFAQRLIDSFKRKKTEQSKEPKAVLKAASKPYRVVELFAGVGGFRIGLENVLKGKAFKVVWSNQYEPGSAKQWASRVYEYAFRNQKGSMHSNKLIEEAISEGEVPPHDVLIGGFPCQDYSVAKPNNQSRGIEGKKGVLWWSIYEIAKQHQPKFLILENVDRLVKSPAKQRGRDFSIMLKCLADLGYVVEWRVINAAEYGMPQRRRRVFIVAYKAKEELGKLRAKQTPENVLLNDGILARAFPVQTTKPAVIIEEAEEDSEDESEKKTQLELFEKASWSPDHTIIEGEPHELTDNFNKGNAKHDPFKSAGLMIPNNSGKPEVWTAKVYPSHKGERINLGDLLSQPEDNIPDEFVIDAKSLKSWVYQKGNKTETRTNYLTTFGHIQALFEKSGVKAKLSNSQKRTWGKVLAEYWKGNPTAGKPVAVTDEESGKQVNVSWQLIADTRFDYEFKEGPLPMPDPLDRPFRTIITSEGGSSPSRFKHVICRECAKNWAKKGKVLDHDCVKSGKFRRLTPEELEQGNMFTAGHTRFCMLDGEVTEVDPKHRAFFMGNALVVGIVESIGSALVGAKPSWSKKKTGFRYVQKSEVAENFGPGIENQEFHFKRHEFDSDSSPSVVDWAKWLKHKTLKQSFELLSHDNKKTVTREVEKITRKIRAKKEDRETKEFKGDKGNLGQLIELVHFGLRRNSRRDYDLSAAKIELKSTGLAQDRASGKWMAKERLTLSQLNYLKMVKCEGSFHEFESIDLLRNILIIIFKYEKRPPFVFINESEVTTEALLSLMISDVIFWKPSRGQINNAFQDWKLIKAMCETGYAHFISERYSEILGTGTRGQGGKKGGGAKDFSRQVVDEAQGVYRFKKRARRLGVPVDKIMEVAKDIPERTKNPGNPKSGYVIPKNGYDIAKHGKYPCQKRAYSIPENKFKNILKKLMERKTPVSRRPG